jgi:magnesium transporter
MSITALLSSADGSDREVDLQTGRIDRVRDDELLWVDLAGHDVEEVEVLRRALGLDDRVTDALREAIGVPSTSVLDGAVQLTLLWVDDGEVGEPVPIQIIAGSGWVITRHSEPLKRLDEQRAKITDQRDVGLLRPVEFVVAILDWHLDGFFKVAERLEISVDRLDEQALRGTKDLLGTLVAMRLRIATARRVAAAHNDVYAEMARPDFLPELSDRDRELLVRAADRLERAIGSISSVREMLIGTFEVHMTRTAQRTNDIMRVLTWTSVILLPAVVVAGIMGMNFKVPIFENAQLFWVVIGFMILTATTTLVIARSRGWL